MKRFALLGEPIAHSLSPAMHAAAFAARGIEATYGLLPGKDAEVVFAEAERTLDGINITAPHKAFAAQRYAAVTDDVGRAASAVNTVLFVNKRPTLATNTDVPGLQIAWRRAGIDVAGETVAVVGAGGAARAAVLAAHASGARRLALFARRMDATAQLVALANTLGIDAVCDGAAVSARLVVMAASALDNADAWLDRVTHSPTCVHDLRYGTATWALRDATLRRSWLYVDGISLLLAQGEAANVHFAGAPLTLDVRRSMAAALAHRLRTAHTPTP